MSRKQLFGALLTLLLLSLGALWFLNHFELREVEVPVPLQGEARDNDLYAAKLFLREMGDTAGSITLPGIIPTLPGTHDALLLDTDRKYLQSADNEALLKWVKQGGHLIFRADIDAAFDPQDDAFSPDPLLDALGLSIHFDTAAEPQETSRIRLSSGADTATLEILFNESFSLQGERPADILMFDSNGIHLLHRRFGAGHVTVLTDMEFLNNYEIGEFDHAEMLWRLVHWGNDPEQIWLVHTQAAVPLWKLLWRHARPPLAIGLLLLLAGLLYASQRFGPLEAGPVAGRRRLLEHIEASGHHFWRLGKRQHLLDSTRAALLKHLSRRHPGWKSLAGRERDLQLAKLLNKPIASIDHLLHDNAPANAENFTRLIGELEDLRKTL